MTLQLDKDYFSMRINKKYHFVLFFGLLLGCRPNNGVDNNNASNSEKKIELRKNTNDTAKVFYQGNKLKSIEIYKNSKLNGLAKYYNPDGTLDRSIMFVNGIHQGLVLIIGQVEKLEVKHISRMIYLIAFIGYMMQIIE